MCFFCWHNSIDTHKVYFFAIEDKLILNFWRKVWKLTENVPSHFYFQPRWLSRMMAIWLLQDASIFVQLHKMIHDPRSNKRSRKSQPIVNDHNYSNSAELQMKMKNVAINQSLTLRLFIRFFRFFFHILQFCYRRYALHCMYQVFQFQLKCCLQIVPSVCRENL